METVNPFENKLITGDCRKVISEMPPSSVDMIVTSPPYWNAVEYDTPTIESTGTYSEYLNSLSQIWVECERVLRDNGKVVINTPILPIPKKVIGCQHTRHIKNINNDIEYTILSSTNFLRYSLFIWQKQTSKMMFGSYPFPGNILENNTVEFINVFVKPGKPPIFSKQIKEGNRLSQGEWIDLSQQIWFMYPEDTNRNQGHPAPFPEKLPGRMIRMYTFGSVGSFPGEIVLDPFCGTGTTCVVAKKMNRRYIGIDISDNYISIAKNRVSLSVGGEYPNLFVGRAKYMGKDELNLLNGLT
jgi:DNA modification methylase